MKGNVDDIYSNELCPNCYLGGHNPKWCAKLHEYRPDTVEILDRKYKAQNSAHSIQQTETDNHATNCSTDGTTTRNAMYTNNRLTRSRKNLASSSTDRRGWVGQFKYKQIK